MRYLHITSPREAQEALRRIGVDPYGLTAMVPKMEHMSLFIEEVPCRSANIMKQEMLAVGGDVAVARGTVGCTIDTTDAIIMGSLKQIERFADKLSQQPFNLSDVAGKIRAVVTNMHRGSFTVQTPRRDITVGDRTLVMGIVNMTPDSFSDGGVFQDVDGAVDHVLRMVADGADIIDIGGESTRPDSDPVATDEELRRVIPLIEALQGRVDVPLSIDTTKAEVARQAVESGAEMINDISSLRNDSEMTGVAVRYNVPVVLMHMRGTPKTMQKGDLSYGSVTGEIVRFLGERIAAAEAAGIDRERIIVDPGIGFGKGADDNNAIIGHLRELKSLGRPILIGTSRKSFIGAVTGKGVSDRIDGTAATVTAAIMNGAGIVRVHDVAFMKGVSQVTDAIVRDKRDMND